MAGGLEIVEREEGGRAHSSEPEGVQLGASARLARFAAKVFLPAGYPASVSPVTGTERTEDYLRYQIFNALQAFCSALAGLISSRAILEGFGVGNANASATHALLLTVLQDSFSRLTTIAAAYLVGPLLSPEAKSFRLLADLANDAALLLDALSPRLAPTPALRTTALCLSGALRALCGVAAGGAKAALALHFASPPGSTGDVGDLNAKDGSKETVLALLGMLAGSLLVPHLTTPHTTLFVLLLLLSLHLLLNYAGLRGVVLRTLNRQRLALAWGLHRTGAPHTPARVAALERLLARPSALYDPYTHRAVGRCTLGSSLRAVLRGEGAAPLPAGLLGAMRAERYVLWFDRASLSFSPPPTPPAPATAPAPAQEAQAQLRPGAVHLHICLREGYTPADLLKAWVHAAEVALLLQQQQQRIDKGAAEVVLAAYRRLERVFPGFVEGLRGAGWDTTGVALLAGAPRTVIVSIGGKDLPDYEARKDV
ncbi:vitamin B6 photo-protection and homoeostasis-domain-containing protein [Mycena belliarum]|uniref:Vitamin B6 photo-protection and homoeostasis-domain-containing protein n=1 Tax=Mycena belliarum TaxID=1033014 RepID=A0AAD6U850_9AGAR|nr:vitamin B6 photo-protection and homoeostasis-domain-containing protein [Mycena belliae]